MYTHTRVFIYAHVCVRMYTHAYVHIYIVTLFIVEHIEAVLELSSTLEPRYLSTNTMKMCADALIKMILTEDVDVNFQKLLVKQAYIVLVASTARNYLRSEWHRKDQAKIKRY